MILIFAFFFKNEVLAYINLCFINLKIRVESLLSKFEYTCQAH